MAQDIFKTTNTKVASLDEAKKILKEYDLKNPFRASSNPFKDGQELKFINFVLVDWEYKGKSGKYLALAFEGTDSTISLSCFNKSDFGYPDATLSGEIQKIENPDKGLHSVVKDFTALSDDQLETIYKWLTKDKTQKKASNKCKVALTTYFQNYYGKASEHTLTNLVKLCPIAFLKFWR